MQIDDDHDGPPVHDFGWWPEIAGVAMAAALVAFLMAFASGSF